MEKTVKLPRDLNSGFLESVILTHYNLNYLCNIELAPRR
jgi:hypothetical protein